MTIWSSEHTFDAPWKDVAPSVQQKYPNPYNSSVVTMDVVDRHVDKNGVLKTHKVLGTKWFLDTLSQKILGSASFCVGSEHTEIDPKKQTLKSETRNTTFLTFLSIHEKILYCPHPEDKNKTLMKQTTDICVNMPRPCAGPFENMIKNSCIANAAKGREALQWVIDKVRSETEDAMKEAKAAIRNMDIPIIPQMSKV